MAITTLFTRSNPNIGGVEFDAVLEDTLEVDVITTGYGIEVGARAADHRIVQPFRWSLVGAVSNNPLRTSVTDFVGALTNFVPGGLAATAAGLAAGFTSGSDDTRASSALEFLIALASNDDVFDVDCGDIQLTNMTVISIRRVKNPANENALIFEAQLQELPLLSTLISGGDPKQNQLREGDPAQSQAAEQVNKGEQGLLPLSAGDSTLVQQVIG